MANVLAIDNQDLEGVACFLTAPGGFQTRPY